MSTRGRIGMELPDGKIKSIYVHCDAYPEGVGAKLKKYYRDDEKIKELLELGDISRLGEYYDEEVSKADWQKYDEHDANKRLELITKAENCTIAYKDRGEDCPVRIDENEEVFLSKLGKAWEEYTYLWKEGYDGIKRWHVAETPYFMSLEDKLERN